MFEDALFDEYKNFAFKFRKKKLDGFTKASLSIIDFIFKDKRFGSLADVIFVVK